MPDTTQELIEMKRRITDLDAEVRLMRGRRVTPRRRFHAGQAGLALVFGLVLSTMMSSETGAQGSPAVEDLVKRIKTLEDKLAQPLTVKAPFRVIDAAGKVMLSVDGSSGQPWLKIGGTDASPGGVMLGVGSMSGSGFVVVSANNFTGGTQIGPYLGRGMGVYVTSPDGQHVEASLALNGTTGKGRLSIGEPDKGGATIGQGNMGGGFGEVRRADGKMGIALGQLDGRDMGVDVFGDNGKELVAMRTDSKGGTVRVMTAGGIAVGALLASENGGGVALTGPSGGKSAVSINVAPSGGKVRVFPAAGGPAQAELTAESSGGAVTLYSTSGTASALLSTGTSGAGALEISRAGTVYVEAGVLSNGVGVVRAGPTIGGPPIGALGFANTIVGKVR